MYAPGVLDPRRPAAWATEVVSSAARVALREVAVALSRRYHVAFDRIWVNLYRDGRDAMGWHRDNERDLGDRPVIASLSLGATRRFVLKRGKLTGCIVNRAFTGSGRRLASGTLSPDVGRVPRTAATAGAADVRATPGARP